jgi:hypothetical protein
VANSDPRLARLAADPGLFAHQIDAVRDHTLLIRLSRADFVQASFLDDRILSAERQPGWLPNSVLEAAAKLVQSPHARHFIFHAGHVGSTLLSRLCEDWGGVLALREPLVLRNLAELGDRAREPDSLISPKKLVDLIATHVALWRRGFADTRAVIIKATSSAARIAPDLLDSVPEARAVYLNVGAERYLTTLLAGEHSWLDLRGHGPERVRRLARLLPLTPPALHSLSVGELAALTWLVERLTQFGLEARFGPRLLSVDFDAFLDDIPAGLARIAAHFALDVPASVLAGAAGSTAMRSYAKAPEHSYSPQQRRSILNDAARQHAIEIRRGMTWLDSLAVRDASVARVLTTR